MKTQLIVTYGRKLFTVNNPLKQTEEFELMYPTTGPITITIKRSKK